MNENDNTGATIPEKGRRYRIRSMPWDYSFLEYTEDPDGPWFYDPNRKQQMEERKALSVAKRRYRGWDQIARRLNSSVPTAMKIVKEQKLPVIRLGAMVYTTEEQVRVWEEGRFEDPGERYGFVEEDKDVGDDMEP